MDIKRIRERMVALGLTEALLAQHCGVDPSELAGWLALSTEPAPPRLLKLASALDLNFEELMGPREGEFPDIVFHGMHDATKPALELAEDCALLLHCFKEHSGYKPPTLEAQDSADVDDLSSAVAYLARMKLGLNGSKPLQLHDMSRLLAQRGILVIPTPAKGNAIKGFPAVFTVKFPGDAARFVVANIAASPGDLVRAMAAAYAYTFEGDVLQGDKLTRFTTRLVHALVPLTDATHTTALHLLCGDDPTAESYIARCEAVFETPIFNLLADWQDAAGCRDHKFVSRILCMVLQDAVGVTAALWNRRHPDARVPAA